MGGGESSDARHDLRTLFDEGMVGGLSDRQLLERFTDRNNAGSEAAFSVLLERHGPMVWGVCRRVLGDRHAAADAFQATFLVLVRRAHEVRVDDSLGRWLYGVSRRVAARARATSMRRAARESAGVESAAAPGPTGDPDHAELLSVLDQEIGRLPPHYRDVVVLCDLERLPHEEAARRLGCPVGTVESRLFRGRQRLRDRLVRRGVAPAVAAVWAESAREVSAAAPSGLLRETARSVASSAAAGTISASAAALAEGVIRMIWLTRLRPLVAVASTMVVATAGVVVLGQQERAPNAESSQAKPARPSPLADGGKAAQDLPANRALAKEQLALIDQALAELRWRAQAGDVRLIDPGFSLWGRRRIEALRASGAGKDQMIAALEKYVAAMRADEETVRKVMEQGNLSQLEAWEIKYRRMEAEMWLNRERTH